MEPYFTLGEEVRKHILGSQCIWSFPIMPAQQNSLHVSIFSGICLCLLWTGLIVGASISLTSPYLSNLTKHGKLFVGLSSSSSLTALPAAQNISAPIDIDLDERRGSFPNLVKNLLTRLEEYSLPKSSFSHFYVFGSFLNILILSNYILGSFSSQIILPSMTSLTNLSSSIPYSEKAILIIVLLLYQGHLSRRWYECKKVHVFGLSRMNIIGYLVGIFHYCFVPLTFATVTTLISAIPIHLKFIILKSNMASYFYLIFNLLLFLCANLMQHQIHQALAKMKKESIPTKKKTHASLCQQELNESQKENKSTYSIPEGHDHFLFSYVTSPHYMMEIIIYLSLHAILITTYLQDIQPPVFSSSSSTTMLTKAHPNTLLVASWLILILPFILTLWVACNLSISASRTYQFYQNINQKAIRYRKSILPYLW